MSAVRRITALAHAWLMLDFFGESRRNGENSSTLTTTIFGQSTLGFIFAALLFPDTPAVAFCAANLSLSTLLVGIGVLGQPARADRARAGEVLVRTAPLPRSALAAARALHGMFYVALITIGLALPPAILSYWITGHRLWIVPAYLAIACCLSGIVSGTLSLVVVTASRWLGPARGQLVNGTLRAALIGGGFVACAVCLRHLQGTVDELPLPRWLIDAWPPYWGARLLGDPAHGAGWIALLVGSLVTLFALAALAERASRAAAGRRGAGPGLLARLDRRLASGGPLLGVVAFTSSMLCRSPSFRSKVLPIFGLPLAMVLLAFVEPDPGGSRLLLGMTLQFPAIYLPFLVAFLAQAERPGLAWVFATSPEAGIGLGRRAALLSLSSHVLLPAHLVTLTVMLLAGIAPLLSLSLALFALASGILVAGLATRSLDAVPFTDDREGVQLDIGRLMVPALVLAAGGGAFATIADRGVGLALTAAMVAAAASLLRRSSHAR